MQRESQALPMSTMMALLVERIATMYVQVREDFAALAENLVKVDVSEADFRLWLDEMVPVKDEKGEAKTGRGLTLAENKRSAYENLWNHDPKVKP